MFYVYLLQSLADQSLYVGCTSNLMKRITEHNQNKFYHTSKASNWKLVYFEGFTSKQDAYGREHSLKLHKQGLRQLKERLRHSLMV